jgi:hypothetical protein
VISYPHLLHQEGPCEIIQCSPKRIRILWHGKPQGMRKFYSDAVRYCLNEGLLESSPISTDSSDK